MGVHGLWRLIEPSGKPIPVENLENKILAVDVSIWLHQAIKGFHDSRGAPLPNAHLLGIYHRVCKLLYFRIKPIFVFDGGVPVLKKQTIVKRQQHKTKILNDANSIQSKLLSTLLKHSAVTKLLSEKTSPPKTKIRPEPDSKEDMFKLPEQSPELDTTLESSIDISSDYDDSSSSPCKHWDLHSIDEKSEQFRTLPADVRHEILTDLKETRKQSSWGRLHELPAESGEFSHFQMKRLLKRNSVQVSLEEAEKEMGGRTLSLGELEALLTEEGIVTAKSVTDKRLASSEDTRYLLIKDVKKALDDAKKQQVIAESNKLTTITEEQNATDDYEQDLAAAIQLSLQEQPSTSKEISESTSKDISTKEQPSTSKDNTKEQQNNTKHNYTFFQNFNNDDFQSESESEEEKYPSLLTQAKSYMMEYTNLTPNEIENILKSKGKKLKSRIEEIHSSSEPVTNNLAELSKKESEILNVIPEHKERDTDLISDVKQSKELPVERDIILINEKNNISINEVESSTIETKINNLESSHENSDIINIKNINQPLSEVQNIALISSDSDSDFVEVVEESSIQIPELKPKFEIIINPKENNHVDDIFSDIFTDIVKEPVPITEIAHANEKVKEILINTEEEIIEKEKKIPEEIVENKEQNKEVEPKKVTFSVQDLNTIKANLEVEQKELIQERNSRERMAGNITDQMYQEAQELLELFGVPYIIAPMEAEAQCAFLNEIDLTDGTITDDSDIWLFGGKTVYKNFFNSNKHVLEFRAESIEHNFKLSREQMILLALLVGSDYTLGIQGIGPVTALEILASFPPPKIPNISILSQYDLITGLTEFRKWLADGKALGVGRTTLRSKLRNVNVMEGFPSPQVVQAYLQPKVETCRDKFTWGKPDVVSLIDFAREKFGWTKFKSEEMLNPVMKKLDEKYSQKTIKDYFTMKHKIDIDSTEQKMSKRVKTAVRKMRKKNDDNESSQEEEEQKPKTRRKETVNKVDEAGPSNPVKSKTKGPKKNQAETKGSKKNKYDPNVPRKSYRTRKPEDVLKKECIPQRERDKISALKNKFKAIEVFRKSKQGPGFMDKRPKVMVPLKDEAELSESSDTN